MSVVCPLVSVIACHAGGRAGWMERGKNKIQEKMRDVRIFEFARVWTRAVLLKCPSPHVGHAHRTLARPLAMSKKNQHSS